MRGVGAVEWLREVLPEAAVPLFGAFTYLGDVALFFVVLTLLYWFGDRRKGAAALGIVLGGLALTLALKATFAYPRPPAALHANLGAAVEGYGFPSGHAVGSTVVWGALAAIYDVSTRRKRIAAAALVVGLVSLSRVVIGVHYLVDVVVGVAVGLVYLVAVLKLTDGSPRRAFAVAAGLGAVAIIASVGSRAVISIEGAACVGAWCTDRDAVALFGAAAGLWLAWAAASVPAGWPSRKTGYAAAVVAMPAFALLWLASYLLAVPLIVTLAVNVVTFAGILALPTTVERFVRDAKTG